MTETTEKTREELEAEVETLRAQQRAIGKVAPELSTRELSPAKPQDHKPADAEKLTLNYKGVTYEFRKRDLGNLFVLDLLEQNHLTLALRKIIGDEGFASFLESIDDGTGYADPEEAGKLLEAIGEKVGTKN